MVYMYRLLLTTSTASFLCRSLLFQSSNKEKSKQKITIKKKGEAQLSVSEITSH